MPLVTLVAGIVTQMFQVIIPLIQNIQNAQAIGEADKIAAITELQKVVTAAQGLVKGPLPLDPTTPTP